MENIQLTLVLDEEKSRGYISYYQYRSEEQETGRPIVDGLYIQRATIGENPPRKMKLSLEWTH